MTEFRSTSVCTIVFKRSVASFSAAMRTIVLLPEIRSYLNVITSSKYYYYSLSSIAAAAAARQYPYLVTFKEIELSIIGRSGRYKFMWGDLYSTEHIMLNSVIFVSLTQNLYKNLVTVVEGIILL